MKSLPSKNKNVKYLLCAINALTKYAWVKPLKDTRGKTVVSTFIELVNKSILNQINHALIKGDNCTTNLCKNG